MRVEYNCISACQHTHCVTENCFTWVCTWCDRTDYTKWSHLDQSQSSVSGPCSCCNNFCSGSLVSYKMMFEDLVPNISHTCFLHAHTSHYFCVFFYFLTDAGNYFFSLIHGHLLYDKL